MRYSLVFENNQEGIGASYDLLFAPCPIWVMGEREIINLNPQSPHLYPDCVSRLLDKEKLQGVKKCVLIVHTIGNGDLSSLEILKSDLTKNEVKYCVIDFSEIK